MKRYFTVCAAAALTFALTGCSQGGRVAWTIVLILLAAAVLGFAYLRTLNFKAYCKRLEKKGRKAPKNLDPFTWGVYGLGGLFLLIALIVACSGGEAAEKTATKKPAPTKKPATVVAAEVAPTENTDPGNWQIRWEIFDGGKLQHTYTRQEQIFFGDPEDYFALPGVSTFRGNNYRNSATYGVATIKEKKLAAQWTKDTGVIEGGSWSGNGWTGQPLIVKWDNETKKIMNLYPAKQTKENLVEVIYASLDGMIYFLDLEDGTPTRDPINVGMCFKGAGTLDPRGYPLLYVGSGDENAAGQRPRMFIISLIDGTILYQYGHQDELACRVDNNRWCAFDSAPLIHAETDTLIWPGESGNLYTIKLNTSYDKKTGKIQIQPDAPVQTRYMTGRTNANTYWLGYEASANIVGNYLYVSENGGMFFCIDLNTMELVWAQDTKDDSNSSPVFVDGAIFTAPSLHWTKNSNNQGNISIYKLNATNGEILWEKSYAVHTVEGVSGGIQSSPLLGRAGTNLEGMIFYGISRTNTMESGTLVALDTETGKELWRLDMAYYAWSSPVGVYDKEGNGYIVLCDSYGTAHFIDGKTGKVVNTLYLGGLVEASPAVYENMLVVGTRMKKICGIRIK